MPFACGRHRRVTWQRVILMRVRRRLSRMRLRKRRHRPSICVRSAQTCHKRSMSETNTLSAGQESRAGPNATGGTSITIPSRAQRSGLVDATVVSPRVAGHSLCRGSPTTRFHMKEQGTWPAARRTVTGPRNGPKATATRASIAMASGTAAGLIPLPAATLELVSGATANGSRGTVRHHHKVCS